MNQFDYIIIGAGSAGAIVAGRLAAAQAGRVLLIEAGPADKSPWIHLPIGYGKLFYHPKLNWMYRTEAVAGLQGRSIYQPRGKVLGGSSAINAMVFVRGSPFDFEQWSAMGNAGWAWDDVLPYFKKLEDHALGASIWHGTGGPVHITDIRDSAHPLTHRFVQAGQEAGLVLNHDLNGATQEGVGYYQINTHRGLRVSSAAGYLKSPSVQKNLSIITRGLARRILFEGRRAAAVECVVDGQNTTFHARKEIILSCGAINSPQLLQLSGIGPAALLQQFGIATVLDVPSVGQNLQDHLCYDHVYRSRDPSLNDALRPLHGQIRAALQYLFSRSGPLSLSVNQGGGFFKTNPDLIWPDMQLYFSPLSYTKAVPGVRALLKPDSFSGFSTSISPCRPTSRGEIVIGSARAEDAPVIRPNYLSTSHDQKNILEGAKFLRKLAETPTFRDVIESEISPGTGCQSDEQLLDDIRANAYSVFHPCGTCRMGPDPATSVVDSRLRVHGVTNLRVIDASIFPTITSGNINAPTMMLGEKGADLILSDHSA